MGHFLAVSAIRAESKLVAASIEDYVTSFAVKCKRRAMQPGWRTNDKTDALVFSAVNGWTRVLWPTYFNVHDFPMARVLSERLTTVASTINIYDGDCWTHGLFTNGEELDRFCSVPELQVEEETDLEAARRQWAGQPALVAAHLGCVVDVCRPYFVHVPEDGLGGQKAFPTDEHELEDFWVFTDFWRAAGIEYPDPDMFETVLTIGKDFPNKLPYNE